MDTVFTLVQIVTLFALAVFLLVENTSAKEIGRVVAGVGAALWALLLLITLF
jgi:hypothetical protein